MLNGHFCVLLFSMLSMLSAPLILFESVGFFVVVDSLWLYLFFCICHLIRYAVDEHSLPFYGLTFLSVA